MVQFISDPNTKVNAWKDYLGYEAERIYKEFPCFVDGLAGNRIRCDLYNHFNSSTTYNNLHINSDFTGPFLIVYGFENTISTGAAITIKIPKIKIGGIANINAWVKLSIL